jgi:hypothetical protein
VDAAVEDAEAAVDVRDGAGFAFKEALDALEVLFVDGAGVLRGGIGGAAVIAIASFYYWWVPMMASTGGISPTDVGTIIGVMVLSLVGGGVIQKKFLNGSHDSGSLRVTMEEQFVTRREFTDFKAEVRTDVVEMKGLFQQTMQKIDIQNTNLTNDIKAMGTGAYQGRHKLWEQVNEQRERVSKLEERTAGLKTDNI